MTQLAPSGAQPNGGHLHGMDKFVIAIGVILIVAYGFYLSNTLSHVNWFSYFVYVVLAGVFMIIGYYVLRRGNSHTGDVSNAELCGTIVFGIGLVVLTIGMFPGLQAKMHDAVPPPSFAAEDQQPPVVKTVESADFDTIKVSRIAEADGTTFASGSERVIVKVSLHTKAVLDAATNTWTIPEIKVSPGSHGKVWYEVNNRPSRGTDF